MNFRGHLIRTLASRGYRVTVCVPDAPAAVREGIENAGAHYQDIPLDRTGINPLRDLQTLFFLYRLIKKIRPEIVFSYAAKPIIWGGIGARLAGCRCFCALFTGLGYAFTPSLKYKQRIVSRIVRTLYSISIKNTCIAFFQNPDDRQTLLQAGVLKEGTVSKIINGSGVDLTQYPVQPLPEKPVFLLVARLIVDKGVHEFRQAAQIIKDKYPEARFIVVGGLDSNPAAITEKELQTWIESGDIEYWGQLEDVLSALGKSQVFVLPSYREGTPRSTLEAMSTGRPVITTDAPGCRETVQHGVNGFLVPAKDPVALAEAMERFVTDPALAETMGTNSRMIAEQKYDVHKVNEEIIKTMELSFKDGQAGGRI